MAALAAAIFFSAAFSEARIVGTSAQKEMAAETCGHFQNQAVGRNA
jgi:hypothetical protein